jgi:ABC-type nitrate/sulfonate/bicarbonate transport system permease component
MRNEVENAGEFCDASVEFRARDGGLYPAVTDVPSAMSWVFSSLHNAVGMSFVGAVIGEYLGSAAGVGYLIHQAEGVFDIDAVI